MRLPWQSGSGTMAGAAAAEVVAPEGTDAPVAGARTRARRWRRVFAGSERAPRAETTTAASIVVAVEPAATPAGGVAAAAPHRGGLVALAIARALIAIDFALGGRRGPGRPGARPRD